MNDRAGVGKIERLPWEIREQVCRKLRDGVTLSRICAWLNALPEVLTILDQEFGEEPVTPQNLSNFKGNGYTKWLARQESVGRTAELAKLSAQLTQANGGTIADGAAAIASGKLLEVLETLSEGGTIDPEVMGDVVLSITRLRKGDQNAQALAQRDKQLDQNAESLALEKQKFQRTTCELFLKWRNDRRAIEIADGPGTDTDKTEALGQHIFGDLWGAAKA